MRNALKSSPEDAEFLAALDREVKARATRKPE
jgi:hypothetical protein